MAADSMGLTCATWQHARLTKLAVVFIVGIVPFACVKRGPTNPVPRPIKLYGLVEAPGGMAIDIIDADSDSVMRRIASAGTAGPKNLQISQDSRYLATYNGASGSGITVFDLQTEAMVASNQLYTSSVGFTRGSEQVVGMSSGTIHVFDLPTLTEDTSFFSGPGFFFEPRIDEEFCMITELGFNHYAYVSYEFVTWAIADSFTLLSTHSGNSISAYAADFSPDGRRLYLLGADSPGEAAVFCLDMLTHEMSFRRAVDTWYGSVRVSPSGDEVWVTQSFVRGPHGEVPMNLGYLLMLDAVHGTPLDTFSTVGLDLDRLDEPVSIRQFYFHPTLDKAFVQAFRSRPAILVFDTKTREVEATIYGDVRTIMWDLTMTP